MTTVRKSNPLLFSQSRNIRFERISTEQGLSNIFVLCIFQDSLGFMWFGTYDGLNKFDGNKFTIYRNDINNPLSIGGNHINTIFEDKSGIIWIGTEDSGLNKFDRKREKFVHYIHDPDDPASLSNNSVCSICEDSQGDLWIGTWGGGLNKFDRDKEIFTIYKNNPEDPTSLNCDFINQNAIIEDKFGNFWIGTDGGGLNKFDRKREKFIHYMHDPDDPASLSFNKIHTIYEDKSNNLLIGTKKGGLNKLISSELDSLSGDNKETIPKFVHYKHNPDDPTCLSANYISCIYEDESGILWIGTSDKGLNISVSSISNFTESDKKNNTLAFKNYKHNPDNPTSLSNDQIFAICEDKSGVFWVGTVNGLNRINPENEKFTHYKYESKIEGSLNPDPVDAMYEDKFGDIWIGNGRLGKFNREKENFIFYKLNPDDSNRLSSLITSIHEDESGAIWIGTFGGGLNKFDRYTNTLLCYKHDPHNSLSIIGNCITSICEQKSGVLWVGTDIGLDKFDQKREQFIHYKHDPEDSASLSDDSITFLYKDKEENLWIGTYIGGLNKLIYKDDAEENPLSFIKYMNDPKNPESISNNRIYTTYEDKSGIMWVGTYVGLNKFDRENNSFKHFRVKDGLICDIINGILEDDYGNLWISTPKGISKFDPKKNKFRNYNQKDGLLNSAYTDFGFLKIKSGELLFGGYNGLDMFNPNKLKDNPHIPHIVITDFKILHKSVPIGFDKSTNRKILEKSITYTKEIELNYKDNVITFEFAALDFRCPERNQYAYKMEGFDKEWVYTDASNRTVSYTNMDPGEYIFRVKGSNNDGVWNEEGTSVRIFITPPWWQTWWFRGCGILFILAALEFSRERHMTKVRKELKQKEEFSRQLISGQEQERKRIASDLHDSHAQNLLVLKNRVSLLLRRKYSAKTAKEELRDISDGLLHSMDEIRTITYSLRPHEIERFGLTDSLVQIIEKVSESCSIIFKTQIENINGLLKQDDEVILYRIVQECLNNIVKHSGAAKAEVVIKKEQDNINIIISDNGKGFDINAVLSDKSKHGIGLMDIIERAKLLNGKVEYESAPGKGTKVLIQIPIK